MLPTQAMETDMAVRTKGRRDKGSYDKEKDTRVKKGVKPHKLVLKEDGTVDASCPAKPAWDEAIRSLLGRCLDVSILKIEKQNPQALTMIREKLDEEFEYTPCTLSQRTFKGALTNSMKTERFRLKSRWKNGQLECPTHVQPEQWSKLLQYWQKKETTEKAKAMATARQEVKTTKNVGRRGKDGIEAKVVRKFSFHCKVVCICFQLSYICCCERFP